MTEKEPEIIISSPGFSFGSYPANISCATRIFAPAGFVIEFMFVNHTFDIEPSLYSTCKYDMVEMRDGPYPYSPILGRFCSKNGEVDESLMSTSNALLLLFTSDSSIEGAGFQLAIKMVKPNISVIPFCRFEVRGVEGTFTLANSSLLE